MYTLQKSFVETARASREVPDRLIFVEHPEVYTFGRRSRPPDRLVGKANTFEVERGGEATYHNPGQLVCYPILRLVDGERDLHLHLRRLEHTLIDVLGDFGIRAIQRPGATGVWIEGKNLKIASIGVAVSGWITYHGSALNVNNDLTGFSNISPCGFSSEVMTSMKKELLGNSPSMNEVKHSFVKHFCQHFKRERL